MNVDGSTTAPWSSELAAIPGPLRRRDERESNRCGIDATSFGGIGRLERRRPLAEGDDGHRPLLDAICSHDRAHRRIREPAEQPRGNAGGIGERQHLGKHRARIPIDVPVSALSVFPAGAPGDAGDDERRRTAARRRTHLQQDVILRVVPMHPGGQGRADRHRGVDLQWEPPARGPRGAEQPRPVGPFHRSHHTGGKMQQTGEMRKVELRRRDLGRPREHADGRRRRGRQGSRQFYPWQRPLISLVEPGDTIEVVHLEVLHHAGVGEGSSHSRPGA